MTAGKVSGTTRSRRSLAPPSSTDEFELLSPEEKGYFSTNDFLLNSSAPPLPVPLDLDLYKTVQCRARRLRQSQLYGRRAGRSTAFFNSVSSFRKGVRLFFSSFIPWTDRINRIEVLYGGAYASFFVMMRWILFLCFLSFVMSLCFLFIPGMLVFDFSSSHIDFFPYLPDVFGEVTATSFFFYGGYPPKSASTLGGYNFPLAFFLCAMCALLLSAIFIYNRIHAFWSASSSMTRSFNSNLSRSSPCASLVFSSWNHALTARSAIQAHRQAITITLKTHISRANLRRRRLQRTTRQLLFLWALRLLLNVLILSLLVLGIVLIAVFASTPSLHSRTLHVGDYEVEIKITALLMTAINIISPFVYGFLGGLERWSNPAVTYKLTLFRTYVMRIFSLLFLVVGYFISASPGNPWDFPTGAGAGAGALQSFLSIIASSASASSGSTVEDRCWETSLGMELHSLLWTSFLTSSVLTFISPLFCRHFLGWRHIELDVANDSLNLIYFQAIIWFGMFYSPMVALFGMPMVVILFYLKIWATQWLLSPPRYLISIYSFARTCLLAMLLTLFICTGTLTYGFLVLKPACGPHAGLESAAHSLVDAILHLAQPWRSIFLFLSTRAFLLCLLVLILAALVFSDFRRSQAARRASESRGDLQVEQENKRFLINYYFGRTLIQPSAGWASSNRMSELPELGALPADQPGQPPPRRPVLAEAVGVSPSSNPHTPRPVSVFEAPGPGTGSGSTIPPAPPLPPGPNMPPRSGAAPGPGSSPPPPPYSTPVVPAPYSPPPPPGLYPPAPPGPYMPAPVPSFLHRHPYYMFPEDVLLQDMGASYSFAEEFGGGEINRWYY
ncbi:hypothetical protein H696_02204 [Fonticula alba]|uniref:TMC domain-containing protein n=1 Tax=Fonticula alba TaxID=691883 RepID=A0A058ZAA7_FONAL|nr:hypothetical protein H696_02204 [Fonticula alba]KCV71254.1 hypothetical protein H696_02204 [Fonticula alba]|eukprot:XP_009494377.1 hypothetical protein H696_02204 [Fonticula alba]